MNEQEAIKALENIIEFWTYKPTEVETAKMAIEALEKQMSKIPILKPFNELLRMQKGYEAICPNCGERLIITETKTETKKTIQELIKDYFANYCWVCGQKLDWGE